MAPTGKFAEKPTSAWVILFKLVCMRFVQAIFRLPSRGLSIFGSSSVRVRWRNTRHAYQPLGNNQAMKNISSKWKKSADAPCVICSNTLSHPHGDNHIPFLFEYVTAMFLQATQITKCYGHRNILNGVNLLVQPDEVVAIFGPNGSGKTTLVKILSTLIKPTTGSLQIGGVDALAEPQRVRQSLGLVLHEPLAYLKIKSI